MRGGDEAALERRSFLASTGRLCLGGALANAANGCTLPVRTARVKAGDELAVSIDRYPELADLGGRVRVVHPLHGAWFITRTESGFAAVSAICPHQGCDVDASGGGFRCPCHGSRFDADGALEGGPARRDLARAPVAWDGTTARVRIAEEDAGR